MAPFDPYHIWLGISETERPISKYRLLGIADFENNREVIGAAAERQTIYLRTLQAGEHAVLVAELLNEVSQARVCLLDGKSKSRYDTQLRSDLEPAPEEDPLAVAAEELAAISSRPATRPRSRGGKPFWQQPWAAAAGGAVVMLLIMLLFGSGDEPKESGQGNSPKNTSPMSKTPPTNTLPASLQEGLVAYYPFNGNANDESGNGNHGEVKGNAQIREGDDHGGYLRAVGNSQAVSSAGGHLIIPGGLSRFINDEFAISVWIHNDVLHHPHGEGYFSLGVANEKDFFIHLTRYKSEVSLMTENPSRRQLSCRTLIDDKIQTKQIVISYSKRTVSMYVNGVMRCSQLLLWDFQYPSLPLMINGHSWRDSLNSARQTSTRMSAEYRNIRIYNRALSEAEVKSLYDFESKPPPVPPPASATESTTNSIGMTLNKIPAGTFMMGSAETEKDRGGDETQHKVTITKPFYMQTTEVTQGQWRAVMGTEPWKGQDDVKEGPNYPASYVTWDDAVAYCEKLSEKEGKTYRLPTEAEWEYACRAGSKTAWSFGDDEKELGDYAWYDKNAKDIGEKHAHQVGLKKSNAFGLSDMHGNVWEWCHDYYEEDYYQQSPTTDPQGPESGSSRVLRGGSWVLYSRVTCSDIRDRSVADYRNGGDVGFRLVRELD